VANEENRFSKSPGNLNFRPFVKLISQPGIQFYPLCKAGKAEQDQKAAGIPLLCREERIQKGRVEVVPGAARRRRKQSGSGTDNNFKFRKSFSMLLDFKVNKV
jgi:hypothetical protein